MTLIWSMSIYIPNFRQNISNGHCDMLQKYKFKIAAVAMLNFAKSGISGYSNTYMANICQCTKLDENICIYDRDMAKNRKFKMVVAAIFNFARSGILGTVILVWAISITLPNLTKISSSTTEI